VATAPDDHEDATGDAGLATIGDGRAAFAYPDDDPPRREHAEAGHDYLGPFAVDRERLVHSRAFRRLQYKTQVFVNHEGDYYRTRLTHTIEVAGIARTVARALGLNEDLAETIALAHDLGHPPFGHAGERALAALMADHGGFEHNAQALRIVDLLERRYLGFRGLNLTHAVREGIWKRRDTPTSRHLGYDGVFDPARSPVLEAQIVDVVDGVAYDHHDLDDALKSGLLQASDLEGVELWEDARAAVDEAYRAAGVGADRAERVRRQETIRRMRRRMLRDLIATSRERIAAAGVASLADVRRHPTPLAGLSPGAQARKAQLQEVLWRRVYRHYRVVRLVEKAGRFLTDLFGAFCEQPQQLPEEYQEWVEVAGLERGVCDYLAGMTDRYAQREHRKVFRPFEPM